MSTNNDAVSKIRENIYRSDVQVTFQLYGIYRSFIPDQTTFTKYRKTSAISRTLVGNKIVDNSDVVGASPVGAAPTTSSFST